MKLKVASLGMVAAMFVLNGCNRAPKFEIKENAEVASAAVERFNETAYAAYRDAWKAAEKLRASVRSFLGKPSAKGLIEARKAWAVAHQAFAETEAVRLPGSPNHPSNPESPYSRVGLWPVTPSHLDSIPGTLRTGLVHDTSKSAQVTQQILLEAHQPSGGQIVMGFQALEFMIYGLDQYDDGAGSRAFTDYSMDKQATRRGHLLHLLAENLTADMQDMLSAWHPSNKGNHRDKLIGQPHATSMAGILGGLSRLCATGLSGTLTKALETGNPGDEWCPNSDTTWKSLEHVLKGMQNVVLGRASARAVDDTKKPLLDLIAQADPELSQQIEAGLTALIGQCRSMSQPMDQLIKQDNADGQARLQALLASVTAQGLLFEKAAKVLRLRG